VAGDPSRDAASVGGSLVRRATTDERRRASGLPTRSKLGYVERVKAAWVIVAALGGAAVGAAAMWLVVRAPDGEAPAVQSAAPGDARAATVAAGDAPSGEVAEVASEVAPFVVVESGLPRRGQWRHGFALADVDADGRVDLVHGPPRKGGGPPMIYRQLPGDGGLRFERWAEVRFPRAAYDYGDVWAGDLDGDGHVDLALAAHQRGLVVLGGDGRGGFVVRPLPALAASFSSRALVVVGAPAAPIVYALADGPALGGRGGRGLLRVAGDDVSIVPGSERLFGDALAAGAGFVVTGSAVLGADELRCAARCEPLPGLPSGALVRAVEVAPDGRVLVAASFVDAGLWVSVVDRLDVGRAERLLEERDAPAVTALARGDVDGDGADEIVASREDGMLLVIDGDAVERWPAPSWRAGCGGFGLEVKDLDGDGRVEIVASFAGEPGAEAAPRCLDGGGFEVVRVDRSVMP